MKIRLNWKDMGTTYSNSESRILPYNFIDRLLEGAEFAASK
jgi:hypothetical protein